MILWQLILNTISVGMFFSVLAISFGFTLRSVKFFNLSCGGAFLVGGYAMFWFYRMLSISFFLSMLLSLTIAGLYLLLSYKFIFEILIRQKAKNLVLLIASFGLLTATSAILGIIFGSQDTFLARHLSDIGTINIFGAMINMVQVDFFIFGSMVIGFLTFMRYKTRFGRANRAIENDIEVAELVGIPKEKTLFKIFFISGTLAGLAGIGESFDLGIIPASGLLIMFPTIVATVVGGMQSFWGGILGAFILAIAQQLTIFYFGGSWMQAVPFVILIIMLLLRPKGIISEF